MGERIRRNARRTGEIFLAEKRKTMHGTASDLYTGEFEFSSAAYYIPTIKLNEMDRSHLLIHIAIPLLTVMLDVKLLLEV